MKLENLPPKIDLETVPVLKQLSLTYRALSELKGYSSTIPNKNILINAVTLNEAKDSSEIENIITTHDELFKAMSIENYVNPSAKEVVNYRSAIWYGYEFIKENNFISTNSIIDIQQFIESNRAGIRKLPGTTLKNDSTGEIIYTPPQTEDEILNLMTNLENYINEDQSVDPLIQLAVIHYQFESIHPFYDGNGRTGRIINVLFLVLKNLLDSPILYLSKYIIKNKNDYYKGLQDVRTKNGWEKWIIYMLKAIEDTSIETLVLIKEINLAINMTIEEIKIQLPRIYSKELVELLFFEFYTKISYIQNSLNVSRRTASDYLINLEKNGFLFSEKIGKEKIYINKKLFDIVQN